MDDKKLTALQQAFVREYLLCRNASEAVRRAGYKSKNPDVDGARLLVNPSIRALVAADEIKAQAKFEVSREMIIKELAAIAFGSMASLFKWDHENATFIPKDNLTPEQMKFIDSIEVKETWEEIPNDDPDAKPWQRTIWKPVKKFKVGTLGREKVKALQVMASLLGYDNHQSEADQSYKSAIDSALTALDKKDEKK